MKYKYISDLHINDLDMLEWRPQFNSVLSYSDFLIEEWNKFTIPTDTVIIVGDIGYPSDLTVDVIKRLLGKKVLVIGNHDYLWGNWLWSCGLFQGIYYELDINGIHIQHIPENNRQACNYYIHGHHHRYDMPGMYNAYLKYKVDAVRLNCSADINGFKPCSIQQLILNKELLIDKLNKTFGGKV